MLVKRMEGNPKLACHICGTKRQRNLIVSRTKKKGANILEFLFHATDKNSDQHVICKRCDMLALSADMLRYGKDWYFGRPMYRYKNQRQIRDVHEEYR